LLRSIILAFMLLWSLKGIAQSGQLTELTEPFADYAKVVIINPQEALDGLLSSNLAASHDESTLAQYYLLLSQAYYNLTYPQKALEHAQLALQHTSIETQPWLYQNVQITLSNALEIVGRPADAMAGLNTAIKWAKQHDDKVLYLQGIFSRGIVSTNMGDYVGALSDFQVAYSVANDDPKSLSKAHVAAMLAQVYEYRHEDSLSIPYFEEAVAAHRLHHAEFDLSIALFGLGKAHRNSGQIELAKEQLQESQELAAKVDDIQGVAYALKELADIDISEKNYQQAQAKLTEAAQIFTQAENHQMSYNIKMTLASLSLETDELTKAQEYLEQAAAYLDRLNMPIHNIRYDETHAGLLYRQQQYQSAYDELKKAFATYRKFQNTDSTDRLHKLRSRFEMQLTQQENEVLAQKNAIQQLQLNSKKSENIQLALISTFTTLACLLLGLIVYRNKIHKQRLEKLVTLDELTGLFNRRHTMILLEQQIKLASRHNKGLCLAMLDLDWFKQINDSYGHLVGDKVLKEFAHIFRKGLRESDVIGRIGGEEFLIILTHSNSESAYEVIVNLCNKLRNIGSTIGEPKILLTVSVGLVECKSTDSAENLISLADRALYRAKNNGRNQIVLANRVEAEQEVAEH
jgi:diguanylate cyclase (GGDEF)-like protein